MNPLKLFNRNRVSRQPVIDERDLHPYAENWDDTDEEDEEFDRHPGQYYCGICGWVDIDLFPHCH